MTRPSRRRPDGRNLLRAEVSLNSGKACADALEGEGFKVTRIDVGADVATVLSALRPDAAFNALHGPDGEDGTIQGLLEILKIPLHPFPACSPRRWPWTRSAPILMRAAGVDVPGGGSLTEWRPPASTSCHRLTW